MNDLDITPFYKELLKHMLRYLLYMSLFGAGALVAFFYISEREEREISLEREEDNNGDSRPND